MKPYRFTWLIAFWVAIFVTYVPWAEHSALHYALLAPDVSESSENSSATLPDEFPALTKLTVKRNTKNISLRMDDCPLLPMPVVVKTEQLAFFHPLNEAVHDLHLHLALLNAASRAPPATDFLA